MEYCIFGVSSDDTLIIPLLKQGCKIKSTFNLGKTFLNTRNHLIFEQYCHISTVFPEMLNRLSYKSLLM